VYFLMRWSIIRLIWLRELRDQLRDRRTILMIAVLPILLYPITGILFMKLTFGLFTQKSTVVVVGAENLPPLTERSSGLSPLPAASWFTVTPVLDGGGLAGVERFGAAAILAQARLSDPAQDYPPLFLHDDSGIRVPSHYLEPGANADTLIIRFKELTLAPEEPTTQILTRDEAAAAYLKRVDRGPLDGRDADLLVVVPSDFRSRLDDVSLPTIYLLGRENDERSSQAKSRVQQILTRWAKRLGKTRLARRGLPATFDQAFQVSDPQEKPAPVQVANELFGLLAKILPVILIMWSLAGALYPAIDVCAGEKERGTMETLLISPASREEIVYGKFLTIWVFSAGTALLNLVSMGATTWCLLPKELGQTEFRAAALFWGVVLLLPVSAFFSAICLAVGAYARSSKEGQYYLLPLFMVTMPLIFLTVLPDVTLNPFWSMVPVTGIALLLQTLIAPPSPELKATVGYFFIPVLLPMLFYSWLALRWAIAQFKREEVLFREAERLDIGLWLKRLFREKELLPSSGEAVFCFVLILLLNRMTLSFGEGLALLVQTGIRYLAFMAAPPLLMALLLTRRPRQGLALRWPPWWSWPAALALAVFLFFPCVESIRIVLNQVPALKALVDEYDRSVTPDSTAATALGLRPLLGFLMVVAVVAVSEEIAFRGFILSGLRQRFHPMTAVFLSSFLFALAQMNVFQFVAHFLLGAVLGYLVLRTGSLLPGIVFHLVYNVLLLGPVFFPNDFQYLGYADESFTNNYVLRQVLAWGGLALAGGVLFLIHYWTKPAVDVEPIETTPSANVPNADQASPRLATAPTVPPFKDGQAEQRLREG
jgi:sodium transport system permease protein